MIVNTGSDKQDFECFLTRKVRQDIKRTWDLSRKGLIDNSEDMEDV